MLVTELIRRAAPSLPPPGDRTALLFGDALRRFPPGRAALQPDRPFLPRGARPRRRAAPIALLLDNGLNSVPCDFACTKAGLRRTPLNGRLSLEEHVRMLEAVGAATLIYGPSQAERAAALKPTALPDLDLHGLGDAEVGADLLAAAEGASDSTRSSTTIRTTSCSSCSPRAPAARSRRSAYQATYGAVVHNVLPTSSTRGRATSCSTPPR